MDQTLLARQNRQLRDEIANLRELVEDMIEQIAEQSLRVRFALDSTIVAVSTPAPLLAADQRPTVVRSTLLQVYFNGGREAFLDRLDAQVKTDAEALAAAGLTPDPDGGFDEDAHAARLKQSADASPVAPDYADAAPGPDEPGAPAPPVQRRDFRPITH